MRRHAAAAYDRWEEFDLIHDHTELGILMGSRLPIPVVHTVHNEIRPALGAFHNRLPRTLHYVCVSVSQARPMPGRLRPDGDSERGGP